MAKLVDRLSPRQVQLLTAPGLHPDGDGLNLQIAPGGGRSWIYRWKETVDGKPKIRTLGLGSAASVSLDEARDRAAYARALRAEGLDPIATFREERAEAKAAPAPAKVKAPAVEAPPAPTFGDIADEVVAAKKLELRNAKAAAQWSTTLGTTPYNVDKTRVPKDAFEAHVAALSELRATPVAEVTTDLVVGVLRPLWFVAPETATRIRQRIETVLSVAKARGLRTAENVARYKDHLAHILRPSRKAAEHHAALPFEDMPAFWSTLGSMRVRSVSNDALMFAILTAARAGEVRGMTWAEVDMDSATWTIPGNRMKAGVEHRVPLSTPALAILTNMQRFRVKGPLGAHVFPGTKLGFPLADMSLTMVLRRLKAKCTVHGFRSTFRDWAAETTNYQNHVVERCLAHTIGNKAEAAYRRGDLLEKRRPIMQEWADYVTSHNE